MSIPLAFDVVALIVHSVFAVLVLSHQRICPPQHPAAMVRRGTIMTGPAVNEMGVYGVFLGDGTTSLLNESAGHLLRTKARTVPFSLSCTCESAVGSYLMATIVLMIVGADRGHGRGWCCGRLCCA